MRPYTTPDRTDKGAYELATLNHVIETLARLEARYPAPKPVPGECYSWDCHCRFRYLAGEWRVESRCARHGHLVDRPEVGI